MKNYSAYSIKNISEWQKGVVAENESVITLPSLQRGFVWKPRQIEALWDSIFSGYPIGSIIVAENGEKKELLDGQQRCTSIALGFYNPFRDKVTGFLSLKDYFPSVWIDLKPATLTNSQNYVFRVLTKSHPWGYQLKDNSKILTFSQRKNAKKFFMKNENEKPYINLLASEINPWDAFYPVPLSFLLEIIFNYDSINFVEFINLFREKISGLKVKTMYKNDDFVNYDEINNEDLEKIYNGLEYAKKLYLPEISIDSKVLQNEGSEDNSQNPTLFLRLNSAGTTISGEEMLYSIYKAEFPESKQLVEEIGASYIAPSKIIDLFSRLAVCEISKYNYYPNSFKVKSFRMQLQDPDFIKKMKSYLYESKNVIEIAKSILCQKKHDSFPKILLKQIITSNLDLFLMLLIYLRKNNVSNINELNQKQIQDISSSYSHLLWFSLDKSKIASNSFNTIIKVNNSWSLDDPMIKKLVIPVLHPESLRSNLVKILVEHKINYMDPRILSDNLLNNDVIEALEFDELNKESKFQLWKTLIDNIKGNKSLLLYAQRNYIIDKFQEFNQFESIEDSSRPFDWDHIYPISWVYNKDNINALVRFWVNSIGNYRALSLDDNRSESNNLSPKDRFKDDNKKEDSFINDDIEFWNKLDSSSWRIKHQNKELIENFLNAVLNRMINIYTEWYYGYYRCTNELSDKY